jgi:hypothetical protein
MSISMSSVLAAKQYYKLSENLVHIAQILAPEPDSKGLSDALIEEFFRIQKSKKVDLKKLVEGISVTADVLKRVISDSHSEQAVKESHKMLRELATLLRDVTSSHLST